MIQLPTRLFISLSVESLVLLLLLLTIPDKLLNFLEGFNYSMTDNITAWIEWLPYQTQRAHVRACSSASAYNHVFPRKLVLSMGIWDRFPSNSFFTFTI